METKLKRSTVPFIQNKPVFSKPKNFSKPREQSGANHPITEQCPPLLCPNNRALLPPGPKSTSLPQGEGGVCPPPPSLPDHPSAAIPACGGMEMGQNRVTNTPWVSTPLLVSQVQTGAGFRDGGGAVPSSSVPTCRLPSPHVV